MSNLMFSRRAMTLGAGKLLLLSTLVARMSYLQLWRSEHYRTLADGNRIRLEIIPASRGNIIDRFGQELAINKKNFFVVIIPEQTEDVTASLRLLQEILELDSSNIERILQRVSNSPKFLPIMIKDNLDWEQVSKIEVNSFNLPGIVIERGSVRTYPLKEHTAHLLGYVQAASKEEAHNSRLLKMPGYRIGKTGIEKRFDKQLQGIPGYREVEVNAVQRVVRELQHSSGTQGKSIQLTIDANLQRFVGERLAKEKSGCAVVIDVKSGDVLALSSIPSFDPNLMVTGIDQSTWNDILANPYNSLLNKAVAGEYAPGSIFKMVVALTALESNVIDQSTRIRCQGYIDVGNHRFHCWRKHGHGSLNLVQAIASSCDPFFYEIAQKVGINKIAATAARFGLGKATGIEMPNEKCGLVPTKSWKRERLGHKWTIGETINVGIGQGYLLSTPLQNAMLMARLVNGGVAIFPRISKSTSVKQATSLGFRQENLELIKRGLYEVMNVPGGTGFRSSAVSLPNWQIGGKTSSTQVRRISIKDRELGLHKQKKRWSDKEHALFAGFAPIHNPKFAVSVVIEHGEWGGSVAAPVARDIFLRLHGLVKEYEKLEI